MIDNNSILFISPHTDDLELGAGGTLSKFSKTNKEIYVAAFSSAKESLKEQGYPEDVLVNEFSAAMDVISVMPERRFLFDFPVRKFSEFRQNILDKLIILKNQIDPDLVIIPSKLDIHQDHQVIHNEATRAFKNKNIWCYELPWNQRKSEGNIFVELAEDDITKKMEMLACYKTQIDLKRPYFDDSFIKGLAKVRGCQATMKYAEAFEMVQTYIK